MLTEDLKALRARYSDIDDYDFWTLISFDPTYKDKSDSAGVYTKWILDKFKAGKITNDDLDSNKLKSSLEEFDKRKKLFSNKDIYQFKTPQELYDRLSQPDDKELTDRQKERQARNSYSSKDVFHLIDTEHFQSFIPLTFEGSCTLGKGTRWCTAVSTNDKAYKQYSEQGPLVVIISKENPKEKYQYHEETNSFMDKEDESVDDEIENNPEIKEIISKAKSPETKRMFLEQTSTQKTLAKSDSFEIIQNTSKFTGAKSITLVLGDEYFINIDHVGVMSELRKVLISNPQLIKKCMDESIIDVIQEVVRRRALNYPAISYLGDLVPWFKLCHVDKYLNK